MIGVGLGVISVIAMRPEQREPHLGVAGRGDVAARSNH
jgi:hypothetical protein